MKNSNEETDRLSGELLSYLGDQLASSTIEYLSTLTPLLGGFDTSMYRFRLGGTGNELSNPLVLRLYPHDASSIVFESTVQNVLAGEGHPVAKVHLVSTDVSILGGAFFIMEYLPGQQLMTAHPEAMPQITLSSSV